MRIAALLVLLAVPCTVAAQVPTSRLEADLAKAKADYERDPSSADNAIRLKRDAEAAAPDARADPRADDVIENGAYHHRAAADLQGCARRSRS
jgi:hypothetical protein